MSTLTKKTGPKAIAPRRAPVKPPRDFVAFEGLTVQQWTAMPDTKPRYELINGNLVQKMTTKRRHAQAAGELLFLLKLWARESGWRFFPEGTGVFINERTGFVPDVTGYKPEVVLDPDENVGGAPFLAVEVLSPGTRKKDRTEKLHGYASIEVELYLLIDPDKRTLEVFRLQENNVYDQPEVLGENDIWQPVELPGLQLELKNLWMN